MSISTVLKEALGTYDDENLYVICVQGVSGSGKTTFSKILQGLLNKEGIHTYLLHLDSFFGFSIGSKEDEFDFDNPASTRWDSVDHVLKCLISKKETIPVHTRSEKFNGQVDNNPGFKVVIIEGLYSFNCFGKEKFNVDELDLYDTHKKIALEYIENDNYCLIEQVNNQCNGTSDNYKGIKTLNLLFSTCFTKLTNIRVQRDYDLLNLTFNEVFPRLCNFVWPATLRWVFSNRFRCDINVQHGNFNTKGIQNLTRELLKFFKIDKKVGCDEFDKKYDLSNIKCLRGCDGLQESCSFYLNDIN